MINRFAGSNPEFFNNFEKDYKNPKTLYLQTNYRSSGGIVDFCNAIMSSNEVQGKPALASKQNLKAPYSIFKLNRDDIRFTLSKSRWETLVKNNSDLVAERPQEGDLVYFPTTKAFFEIQFVEHEQPFYQQSALPVYKLSCTRFEYSSERIDTGIAEIDKVEDSLSTDTMNFQFSLENETGSIVLESSIGAIDYMINEDFTMATQQPTDQGQAFETEAGTNTAATTDDILDFSERNPFGEVDEY